MFTGLSSRHDGQHEDCTGVLTVMPRSLFVNVFEVAIGAAGTSAGMFRVEVVRSSVGETSTVVKVDVAALAAHRAEVQQALLASATRVRRMVPAAERLVQQIGQDLFTALLGTKEVASRYRSAAAVATDRGERLRVVVRIDSPLLAGLPWEAMYDQALGATCAEQLVSRCRCPLLPAAGPAPLRIMASSPRDLAIGHRPGTRPARADPGPPAQEGLVQVR
jgi:hypothetical protein